MHKLNVKEKYYKLLKSGVKTIELRLFDEKRRNIKIGDCIEFFNLSNEHDKFVAVVVNLYRADNFIELSDKIDCCKAGFFNKDELVLVLEEFYSKDRQQKYGVVGIEVVLK